MLHMTLVFEDQIVIARRGDTDWIVEIQEMMKGLSKTFTWSDQQFAAVMALAIGSDTVGQEVEAELYKIAGSLFTDCQELSIIP